MSNRNLILLTTMVWLLGCSILKVEASTCARGETTGSDPTFKLCSEFTSQTCWMSECIRHIRDADKTYTSTNCDNNKDLIMKIAGRISTGCHDVELELLASWSFIDVTVDCGIQYTKTNEVVHSTCSGVFSYGTGVKPASEIIQQPLDTELGKNLVNVSLYVLYGKSDVTIDGKCTGLDVGTPCHVNCENKAVSSEVVPWLENYPDSTNQYAFYCLSARLYHGERYQYLFHVTDNGEKSPPKYANIVDDLQVPLDPGAVKAKTTGFTSSGKAMIRVEVFPNGNSMQNHLVAGCTSVEHPKACTEISEKPQLDGGVLIAQFILNARVGVEYQFYADVAVLYDGGKLRKSQRKYATPIIPNPIPETTTAAFILAETEPSTSIRLVPTTTTSSTLPPTTSTRKTTPSTPTAQTTILPTTMAQTKVPTTTPTTTETKITMQSQEASATSKEAQSGLAAVLERISSSGMSTELGEVELYVIQERADTKVGGTCEGLYANTQCSVSCDGESSSIQDDNQQIRETYPQYSSHYVSFCTSRNLLHGDEYQYVFHGTDNGLRLPAEISHLINYFKEPLAPLAVLASVIAAKDFAYMTVEVKVKLHANSAQTHIIFGCMSEKHPDACLEMEIPVGELEGGEMTTYSNLSYVFGASYVFYAEAATVSDDETHKSAQVLAPSIATAESERSGDGEAASGADGTRRHNTLNIFYLAVFTAGILKDIENIVFGWPVV